MADQTFNKGNTTFAASGWSGAGLNGADNFYVQDQFGPVSAGLSYASTDTPALEFVGDAEGVVGGGAAGSLIISLGKLRMRSTKRVTVYLTAGGTGNIVDDVDLGPRGTLYATGGTFTDIAMDGGRLEANDSTVITNIYAYGGTSVIEPNGTNITLGVFMGGTHEVNRYVTTMIVGPGAIVTYRATAGTSSGTTLQTYGGILNWLQGDAETVEAHWGLIDTTNMEIATTPGSTSFELGAADLIQGANFNNSNVEYVGEFGGRKATQVPS